MFCQPVPHSQALNAGFNPNPVERGYCAVSATNAAVDVESVALQRWFCPDDFHYWPFQSINMKVV
jgi:hypothetical protein